MKIFNNQSGMSLIEVMIASSIMMVLALGFATLLTNTRKEQKNIQTKSEYSSLSSNVRAVASSVSAVRQSMVATEN